MKLREAGFFAAGLVLLCIFGMSLIGGKIQYSRLKRVEGLIAQQAEKIPDQIIVESSVPCTVVIDKNNTRVQVSSAQKR
jgi:hypothetical protein